MRVYTIADTLVRDNFPHDNYYKMTLVWLNHNIKYMSECDITIYYTFEENNALFTDHFQNFVKNFDNVTLKKLKPAYGFPIPNPTLCMLPYVRNYMMSVWDEPSPYVWIDTDLYLQTPLQEFYKHLDSYPFIGTGHGGYNRGQEHHMNGGFYGVSDDDFINSKDAFEFMKEKFPEGSGGRYAADHWRQQHTINEWVKHKNYDPFAYDDKHYFWNWFASNCRFNEEVEVVKNEKREFVHGFHFFGTRKPFRVLKSKKTFWRRELQKIEELGTLAVNPEEDWNEGGR